jgi:alpha-ribazole phosphatase
MTAKTLHLLRHGTPEGAGLLLGHTDTPATQHGRALCRMRAKGLPVGQIIASDLARARASGQDIAVDLGLPLAVDPAWRELCFGAWEGRDPASLGDGLHRFWLDPDANPPPHGERWQQITARVGAALAALAGDALVVTHAGAIRAALALLLGLDHAQVWAFDLPYGALVSLRIWPDGAQVTGLVT